MRVKYNRSRKGRFTQKSIDHANAVADKILEAERIETLKKRVEYLEGIAKANGVTVA